MVIHTTKVQLIDDKANVLQYGISYSSLLGAEEEGGEDMHQNDILIRRPGWEWSYCNHTHAHGVYEGRVDVAHLPVNTDYFFLYYYSTFFSASLQRTPLFPPYQRSSDVSKDEE